MAQDSQQTVVTSDANILTPGGGVVTSGIVTLYVFKNGQGVLSLKIKDATGTVSTLNDSTSHPCTFL
jgi:hypothetical protein